MSCFLVLMALTPPPPPPIALPNAIYFGLATYVYRQMYISFQSKVSNFLIAIIANSTQALKEKLLTSKIFPTC